MVIYQMSRKANLAYLREYMTIREYLLIIHKRDTCKDSKSTLIQNNQIISGLRISLFVCNIIYVRFAQRKIAKYERSKL